MYVCVYIYIATERDCKVAKYIKTLWFQPPDIMYFRYMVPQIRLQNGIGNH